MGLSTCVSINVQLDLYTLHLQQWPSSDLTNHASYTLELVEKGWLAVPIMWCKYGYGNENKCTYMYKPISKRYFMKHVMGRQKSLPRVPR